MSLDKTLEKCRHCGLTILDKSLVKRGFCCLGCENAYEIISETGLGNYYKFRVNDPKIRNIKPDEDEIIDIKNFIKDKEGGVFEIFLAIDGLHCAACVWLIETILKKQENVVLARINLSKRYLKLRWKGEKEFGQKLVNIVFELGYKLFPFDEKILSQEDEKYHNLLIKSIGVAGFGVGNLMLISIILWLYDSSEIGFQTRNFLNFLSALIAGPAIIYSSRVFFYSAFKAIKSKRSNMDIAISVAILLTFITSFVEVFKFADHIYFDSAMMLTFFLLISKYLDFRARKKSFDISNEFSFLESGYARVLDENNMTQIISSLKVKKDMILIVALGEKLAADGILIDEESEFDNSMISGESLPKKIKRNENVFAGAINLSKAVKIKVTKDQEHSLISQIKEIIETSENYKNKYVRLADRLSYYYTPSVHILAIFTFCFWYFYKNLALENSILNAISVLIITCPCALALAVPIAQSLAIYRLLKKSVLLKSGSVIEKISKAKFFVFDKTGSLTYGKVKITKFESLTKELSEEEKNLRLKIASSLAIKSKHPISKAIAEFYDKEIVDLNVDEKKGYGLKTLFENKEVKLGNIEFVGDLAIKFDDKIDKNKQKTFFLFGDELMVFYFEDILKSDAKEVIKKLKNMKKSIILLSGDEKNIVEKTALNLDIKDYYYQKNPKEKAEIIKKLQSDDKLVVMVGDGINDSGSLALADISISFLKGSDLAKNNSDMIIQNEELSPILSLLSISKKSLRIIKQNLFFSLIYNVFAVSFAFFGFLTPLLAALAMSCSSLIVILNSLRIIKNKP